MLRSESRFASPLSAASFVMVPPAPAPLEHMGTGHARSTVNRQYPAVADGSLALCRASVCLLTMVQLEEALQQEFLLTYELRRNSSLISTKLDACRAQGNVRDGGGGGVAEGAGRCPPCTNASAAVGGASGQAGEMDAGKVKGERDALQRERDEALLKLVACQVGCVSCITCV